MTITFDLSIWAVIIAGMLGWIWHQHKNFCEVLKDPKSQIDFAKELRNPWRVRDYRRYLFRSLRLARRWFGRGRFSLRGYGVCLTIALVYPSVIFILVWAMGGPARIGQTEVLPLDWSVWQRALLSAFVIVMGALFFTLFRNVGLVQASVDYHAWKIWNGLLSTESAKWAYRVPLALCIGGVTWAVSEYRFPSGVVCATALVMPVATLAVAGLYTASWAGANFSAWCGAWSVIVGWAGAVAFNGAKVWGSALIMTLVCTVILFMVLTISNYPVIETVFGKENLPVLVLFWLLLPLINAFWDWLSWGISRRLGAVILVRITLLRIVVHGLIDAGAALVLLICLAVSLSAAVEGVNLWAISVGAPPPLDIHDLLTAAAADPWGPDGLWVTAMLVTTLIPTAAHLLILIASVFAFTYPPSHRLALAATLERADGDGKHIGATAMERSRIAWWMAPQWAASTVGTILLFVGACAAIAWAAEPVASLLLSVALGTIDTVRSLG